MIRIAAQGRRAAQSRRITRGGRRFFDNPDTHPPCLGCPACPDYATCGGLHLHAGALNCLEYCCGNPTDCDNVCVRSPRDFADRVLEIGGFHLSNVPRAPTLSKPAVMPQIVPLVYHGSSRSERFSPPAVALPLFAMLNRASGEVQFQSRDQLLDHFRIGDSCLIVLTGTDTDRPLERWWVYGARRMHALEHLARFGIEVITGPNYSLFSDAPRWTDMHAMKRIAITWQEIASVGIRSALHLNARTEKDWRRWRDFVGERDEINCLAFEFATGAADPQRMGWHTDQLCGLAAEVQRPFTLFVRGGTAIIRQLEEFFDEVTLIDARPFMKAVKRQEASRHANGHIRWQRAIDTPVQELLEHNYACVHGSSV
jgi:hypothetical protein